MNRGADLSVSVVIFGFCARGPEAAERASGGVFFGFWFGFGLHLCDQVGNSNLLKNKTREKFFFEKF